MEKSFYDEWETIHSTNEWGQYPTEPVIRFVARNYYNTNRAEVKILDYGCGAGAHTWYLAREGFDTYAFDGSESAVKKVLNKLNRENLKANVCVADALNCDYPADYFDAVIDNVCVYSNLYKHIQKMYSGIYNMLKKKGKLFSTCFGKNTDGYGTGKELEKDTYVDIETGGLVGRGITHFYSKEELEGTLRQAGFNIVSIDRILWTDRGNQFEQFIAVVEK